MPTTIPASWYVDPAIYERERREIFARTWCFVGGSRRLTTPGSYVACSVAGLPVLVVNDAGTLNGFHNVCRHRGGPLVWEGTGITPSLVCRYHGWAYGLDGRLRSARDFGDGDLRADDICLPRVRVDTWRGLVFANFDVGAPPLVDWLGGIVDDCAPFEMERFEEADRSTHHLEANWKVYAENYQEGYHIPLVHPGLNRQIDAKRYEVEVRGEYCIHRAPARDGSATAGVWLWRWPGLALNLYGDGMSVESYAPTGPTTTAVSYQFFFSPGAGSAEREAAVASSTTILDEDRTICEAVQRNMASGLYSTGLLSPRHEGGVARVQALARRAIEGSGREPEAGSAIGTGDGAQYDR